MDKPLPMEVDDFNQAEVEPASSPPPIVSASQPSHPSHATLQPFTPQASQHHPSNHIELRRDHPTPRIPSGPRRRAALPRPRGRHPHIYGYRNLDDPRASYRQPHQSAALDYDEPEQVQQQPLEQAGQPHHPKQYDRERIQYEQPVARPYIEFLGYDDLVFGRLKSIWDELEWSRLPPEVANKGQEASFEQEDHFLDVVRIWKIERKHEAQAWASGDLTRTRIKNNAFTADWDAQKEKNGLKLEDDSYVGPGPERGLRDLRRGLERTSLGEESRRDSVVKELLKSIDPDNFLPREPVASKAVEKDTIANSIADEDVDMDASPYQDRRRDNRRGGGRHSYGGGGGGGGGGRKRGREDDDDQRDYVKKPRPRYEEPIASRIRRDIIFIGEESLQSSPQVHCAGMGGEIANNFEDDQVRGPLLDTLVSMICEQPLKIPFIAALTLYANDINAEVSRELIVRTSKKMASALELGEWRDFKLLLRYQAYLQGILEGAGVFQILNQLFDWVIDLQEGSAEDALGLELTKIILLTIPYAIAASPSGQAALGDLLDKTEIVAGEAANHPLAALVDPYPINGEDKPFGYQSVVELLQKQLREEASHDWPLKCIARAYVPIKEVKSEGENGAEKEASKHTLPALVVPVPIDITKKPLVPETFFTMFADQDIQTVPAMNDISLSLIRDTLADSISILHYNRLAVANFLTAVDQFWAPGTFATRGISLDQLRNYPPERSKWKPEDMFIDAVFSQMLVLPDADQKLVYYHSIIFEACKLAPSAVAPTLGRGIRWLFRHVDDLDLELVYRLLDWFAHHLSNFEFRWKWTEWIGELDGSDLSPKKAFIIAALDKEVRLSFAKRIRDTLPEPYYALLTEGKFKDIPPFKYDNDETPFASEGKEIYKMMKQKLPEEQIQPYIDAIQEQASSLGLDPLLASTDVYMTAMCHNGAKSVSHITAAMDRSKTRLQEARQASPGVGRQIVEAVVTYWKDQPGNAVNIVDKLLNYNIILPDSVIEWALGPGSLSNGAVLSQAWRYEIVAKTMTKVTGRVQEIAQAKVKLEVENDYEPTEKLQQSIPQVNDILDAERPAMRQLFATIDDAVSGVSAGAADGFLETPQSDEDAALIKTWGEKWLRTFRRKLAVVEARVSEASVEAQLVSGKEQFKLLKEREARQKAEDDAARAKEEAELQARLAKEAEERAAAEAAAAATEANGDTAMDGNGMNGHGENDDLDVAE